MNRNRVFIYIISHLSFIISLLTDSVFITIVLFFALGIFPLKFEKIFGRYKSLAIYAILIFVLLHSSFMLLNVVTGKSIDSAKLKIFKIEDIAVIELDSLMLDTSQIERFVDIVTVHSEREGDRKKTEGEIYAPATFNGSNISQHIFFIKMPNDFGEIEDDFWKFINQITYGYNGEQFCVINRFPNKYFINLRSKYPNALELIPIKSPGWEILIFLIRFFIAELAIFLIVFKF